MSMPHDGKGTIEAVMALMATFGKMPAPDKVYYELQRFNNNMERMQPDMTKLAKALEGIQPQDIRALTTTLQGMNISQMLLTLNDANSTIKALYEKLWGKK